MYSGSYLNSRYPGKKLNEDNDYSFPPFQCLLTWDTCILNIDNVDKGFLWSPPDWNPFSHGNTKTLLNPCQLVTDHFLLFLMTYAFSHYHLFYFVLLAAYFFTHTYISFFLLISYTLLKWKNHTSSHIIHFLVLNIMDTRH